MRVAVLGSLNVDFVLEVERLPGPGEVVLGDTFRRTLGGRGNNQAIAAARLGADVALFGKVGSDRLGRDILHNARKNGVDTSQVAVERGAHTGTTFILVDGDGENMIAYSPGANARVDEAYVRSVLAEIAAADVVLAQLEIPKDAVAVLLEELPPGPLLILDPSGASSLDELFLERVDYLVPNREMLRCLTGEDTADREGIRRAGERLLRLGARHLVVKAGPEGAFLLEAQGLTRFPAYQVSPVDSTGAGDAFIAALGCALGRGRGIYEAIGFANAAAALAVTRRGAAASFPTGEEVSRFLRERFR